MLTVFMKIIVSPKIFLRMKTKALFFAALALISVSCTKTEKVQAPPTGKHYGGFFIKETKNGVTKWGLEVFKIPIAAEHNRQQVLPAIYDSMAVGLNKHYMVQKDGLWQLFNAEGKPMLDGISFISAEPQWNSFEIVHRDIMAASGTQPFPEGLHFRLKAPEGFYITFIKEEGFWSFFGPCENYWPGARGFFVYQGDKIGFKDIGPGKFLKISEGSCSFEPGYDALIEVIGQEKSVKRVGFLALKDGKWVSLTEYGNPGKWTDAYIKKLLEIPAVDTKAFSDMVIYQGNRYDKGYAKLMSPDGRCGTIYINCVAGERGDKPQMPRF